MGNVIGLSKGSIRAAASPDGVPTFWLSGEVGFDFKGLDLAAAVSSLSEVRLLLDTVGGDAADAFAFYDAVRVKGLKVHVEGYGRVASAGTVIMAAAGRGRSSLAPNAEYLIHEASGPDAVVVERYNERMARIYSELSGMSEKDARKLMKEDRFMSAQEAKKLKLVGAVLNHTAVAAHYKAMENTNETVETIETVEQAPIETAPETVDTTEVETEIPVTPAQAVEAAFRGFIKAKVTVAAEMSTAVSALAEEVKGVKAQLQEASDEVTALKEKLATAEDARVKAEAEAAEVKAKAQEITVELERIKAEPLVAAVTATAERDVQVPGGGPSATKSNKTTAQEDTMRESMDRWGFNKSKA